MTLQESDVGCHRLNSDQMKSGTRVGVKVMRMKFAWVGPFLQLFLISSEACSSIPVHFSNHLGLFVGRIFNATRPPPPPPPTRHIQAAAIVMYMYLYSLAFMDHSCTRCRCLLPSAALSTLYSTQGTSSMS